MGRGLSDSSEARQARGVAWCSHFRGHKHPSGPPIMLGTGTEILKILDVTPPSTPSRPWEVSKYHNQISGPETAEAMVGKCFGLAWPPPLSWEFNSLALSDPSLWAPKLSWPFSGLCWPGRPQLTPGFPWIWWRFLYPGSPQFRGDIGWQRAQPCQHSLLQEASPLGLFSQPAEPSRPSGHDDVLTCEPGMKHQDLRVITAGGSVWWEA